MSLIDELRQRAELTELRDAISDVLEKGYGGDEDAEGLIVNGRGARIDAAMDALNWNKYTTLRRIYMCASRHRALREAGTLEGTLIVRWPDDVSGPYKITVDRARVFSDLFLETCIEKVETWLTEKETSR